MLFKGLPMVLAVIVLIGIITSVVYLQTRKPSPDAVPPQQISVGQTAAAVSPSPNDSISDLTTKPTNMNPDLSVDTNGLSKATAVIKTTEGLIRIKFYPKDAPNTVNRIIELINKGFYNGLGFHRVIPGFVAQGGDPSGTGAGGSGVKLKAEFNERKHVAGSVAMARSADPDSADSQFYISLGVHPHLDRSYTVFGQVIEGMEVANKLQIGSKVLSAVIE